jgi:hypothetical protein
VVTLLVMALRRVPAKSASWRCAMPKRRRPEFIPADPNSPDRNVKLPRQARVALEHAEALVAGRPPRPVTADAASLTDAQIDAVLARLDRGKLSISDRDPGVVIALIREGARRIKADRQKTQTPKAQATRKAKKAAIELRQKLVIEAVIKLPPKRKQHLTGAPTIKQLARVVTKRLGGPVAEATIRHDIRELRPYLRALVREGGRIPPPGEPRRRSPELQEQTRRDDDVDF